MKGAFARADRSHTKAHRTEMSMRSNWPRNHWKTRFRKNVITLIEEIVAFVDHLAKPFMAMFAMAAAMAAVLYYFKNLIVRLRFSNTRQVLHFCMWNFIQENKAN